MTLQSFGQLTVSTQSIKYYEDCILKQYTPMEAVSYKYATNLSYIVWNDYLKNADKYSQEALELLGYTYLKMTVSDNSHNTVAYRNCNTGIAIEVTEWYNLKISISIQWYPKNVRSGIYYFLSCH